MKISADSVWVKWRGAIDTGILLKGPAYTHMHSQTLALNFSKGIAAQKVPETYNEELNSLASEKLQGQLSRGRKCWQVPLFLCWALLAHSLHAKIGAKSESPLTCETLLVLPWGFHEIPPHQTRPQNWTSFSGWPPPALHTFLIALKVP